MRSHLKCVMVCVVSLILAACHPDSVVGDGKVIKATRDQPVYSRVQVNGNMVVNYKPAAKQSIVVQADSNIVPIITTDVKDGVLIIQAKPGVVFSTANPIVVNLQGASIGGVSSSGANTITMAGLSGKGFTVEFNGSGEGTFSGNVQQVRYQLVGASQVNGQGLKSVSASVELVGASELSLSVSKQLAVKVSGVGKVTYYGDPEIQQQISGLGVVVSGK